MPLPVPRPNVGLRPGQIAFWRAPAERVHPTARGRQFWSMDGRRWVELDPEGVNLQMALRNTAPFTWDMVSAAPDEVVQFEQVHTLRWAAQDLRFETELANNAQPRWGRIADPEWGDIDIFHPVVIVVHGHHNRVGDFLREARGHRLVFRPGRIHDDLAFRDELPRRRNEVENPRRAGHRASHTLIDEAAAYFVQLHADTTAAMERIAEAQAVLAGGAYARVSAAHNRARELLLEHLNEQQRQTYETSGYFDVTVPSGRTYRIRSGVVGNVSLLDANGLGVVHYCAHARGAGSVLPEPDVHLGQMLVLLADEAAFLAKANAAIVDSGMVGGWVPPELIEQRIAEVDRQLAARS